MGTVLDLKTVLEHLNCPICFELPVGSVFQCKDGHVICDSCYNKLSDCPQCRIPFRKKSGAIRNRHMEATLDELRFQCPFKESGCGEKLDRKELQSHVGSCRFGLPEITCKKCNEPVDEIRFQSLHSADHTFCIKCFWLEATYSIIARVKGVDQYWRLKGAEKNPALPSKVDLGEWWIDLDPYTKKLLHRKYLELKGKQCDNPECSRISTDFICAECPLDPSSRVDLCWDCAMGGFHQHHILAAVSWSFPSSLARRFLIYCQLTGKSIIPVGKKILLLIPVRCRQLHPDRNRSSTVVVNVMVMSINSILIFGWN